MADSKFREIVLAGTFGAVFGSAGTGLINAYIYERQQRIQATFDSLKFEQGNYPEEFFKVKQFYSPPLFLLG